MKSSIAGICLIGAMAVFIGIMGIQGITVLDESYRQSQELYTDSISDLTKIMEYTHRLKLLMYDISGVDDYASSAAIQEQSNAFISELEMYFDSYDYKIVNPEARRMFDEAKNAYHSEYKPAWMEIMSQLGADEYNYEWIDFIDPAERALDKISSNCARCVDITFYTAESDIYSNRYTAERISFTIIVLIAVEAVLMIIFIVAVAIWSRSQKRRIRVIDSASPVNPPNPVYPVYPMFPVYQVYPADPSNTANPAYVMYPMPVNPAQPVNQAQAVNPAQPADPVQPNEPKKSEEESKTGD